MNKRQSFFSTVGGSSILTVVAVLCLVTFSLLALSSVNADDRLSRRSGEAVEAYYRADSLAQERLAQLRAGLTPQGVTEENGIFSYTCPIAEGRALQVRVAVEGAHYTVLQWQAVSTDPWQADDSLPVWQGSTQEGA